MALKINTHSHTILNSVSQGLLFYSVILPVDPLPTLEQQETQQMKLVIPRYTKKIKSCYTRLLAVFSASATSPIFIFGELS